MSLALAAVGPADDLFGSPSSEELSRDLYSFDEAERSLLTHMARRMALDWLGTVLVKLARYLVDDGGRSKIKGAGIRAFVFASCVMPSMHGLTQTELGEVLGLHKQSVGRQVSRFRDLFPGVAWGAMQSEQAREACREREARKVEVKFGPEESFAVAIDFTI